MTVDESPSSPSHHTPPKAKTAMPAQPSPAPPTPVSPQDRIMHRTVSPVSHTHRQDFSSNHQTPNAAQKTMFEQFAENQPQKANEMLEQLSEISGVKERNVLFDALNRSREKGEFNMNVAVENLLLQSSTSDEHRQSIGNRSQDLPQAPTNLNHNREEQVVGSRAAAAAAAVPVQPPNSPNSTLKQQQPIVDLTEATQQQQPKANSKKQTPPADSDLARAIQLSLQDANRSAVGFEGGHMSQEDQDVSRALEASLLETSNGKRKRGDNWIDPLNPRDRERNGLWPVGLKNVGQTCWFSAVMQSLFYLPKFRSLVLDYQPRPEEKQNKDEAASASAASYYDVERGRKIVEFMQELRKLFALMVATRRKYVDPTRAVDILRGSIGSSNVGKPPPSAVTPAGDAGAAAAAGGECAANNQQDVSEFTHIVLEWVEEAFKAASHLGSSTGNGEEEEEEKEKEMAEQRPRSGRTNPMSNLFYGQVLIEGTFHGEPFVRTEAFGQWPLQVNSYTDIHESLEGSTAHEFFDGNAAAAASLSSNTSGQERWFTQLPPVLFLELSRFQYNTERKVAEKIHNRLDFPELIYMDRYMKVNKNVTRERREQVRSLKERRTQIKAKLDSFANYVGHVDVGVDVETSKTISLPSVLQFTLDFANSSSSSELNPPESSVPGHLKDVHMNSPSEVSTSPGHQPQQQQQPMMVDSPCSSPKVTPATSLANIIVGNLSSMITDEGIPMDFETSNAEEPPPPPSTTTTTIGCDTSDLSAAADADLVVTRNPPCPRYVSDLERSVLQNCLSRWKEEVRTEMTALESAIKIVEKKIDGMYSEPNLTNLQYRLHAVMVHEGGVDSGHYWAYVRDHKRKVWLKFNDNTVNEASWDELVKESVGGHSNTSAYSLVYIDTSKPELLLLDSIGATAIGETQEDRMEEGEIEALALTLPQDLAEHVSTDNCAFNDEIVRWDKEQEAKLAKQREAAASAADLGNDVQVVQAKLTHVNNHAKLSVNVTLDTVKGVMELMRTQSAQHAVQQAMARTLQHFDHRSKRILTLTPRFGRAKGERRPAQEWPNVLDVPVEDLRLESFVIYLIKNQVKQVVVELAVLEQFSVLSSDTYKGTGEFRSEAEKLLNVRRSRHPNETESLQQWHHTYHRFRRSAHFFVAGLENVLNHRFEESLGQFTEALRITEETDAAVAHVRSPFQTLSTDMIARFVCLVLPEVNQNLIMQFKVEDELTSVIESVRRLVVPTLIALQNRCSRTDRTDDGGGGLQAHTPDKARIDCDGCRLLEDIRNDWCALLGESDPNSKCGVVISDILRLVLEPSVDANSKKSEVVDQAFDITLSERYGMAARKYFENMENKSSLAATTGHKLND